MPWIFYSTICDFSQTVYQTSGSTSLYFTSAHLFSRVLKIEGNIWQSYITKNFKRNIFHNLSSFCLQKCCLKPEEQPTGSVLEAGLSGKRKLRQEQFSGFATGPALMKKYPRIRTHQGRCVLISKYLKSCSLPRVTVSDITLSQSWKNGHPECLLVMLLVWRWE